MKVYHGTSFEKACQILSKQIWQLPIELSLKSEYDVNKILENEEYIHKEKNIQKGLHFTTSLVHAKKYADLNEKPVVLFFDYDTSSCMDFIIDEPIETSIVKCIDSIYPHNGALCNILYGRKSKYSLTISLSKRVN